MAYINKEGKIGTLFEMGLRNTNPLSLSEEELLELGIEKYKPEPIVEDILPLDEYKVKKMENISREVHKYVTDKYPYYKQLSALNGTYDEATNLEITSWCDGEVKRALTIKDVINSAKTHEEVDAIYYRKVEYDEQTLEEISVTFWGE